MQATGWLLVACLLSPVASGPAAGAQAPGWRAEVAVLLEKRARAVERGDRGAFAATMRGAPRAFVRDRLDWFDRLRALPLQTYRLRLEDDDTYLDLAPALARAPDAETHVVVVTERIALRGYDRRPASEALILTVARRRGGWGVVADDDLEDLGVQSARNLWDFAPVTLTEGAAVAVLHHGDEPVARRLIDGASAAIDAVRDRWPLAWRAPVVLAVPRSSRDLGRIFQTTVDLGPFVAFAASSVERDDGSYALTAPRVYLQPDTYFGYSEGFQRETLAHEMLHVATRGDAGPFTTSWLDEGVAQVYGEEGEQATDALASAVRDGSFPGRLPEDHEFYLTPDGIALSYQAAASFVLFLRDRFGARDVARFYRAVGRESAVAFGTARYHLDRASRAVFHEPFDTLERGWVRLVRSRYG